MGVLEALLPGMAEEKRFRILRGFFAAGHVLSAVLFFLPSVIVTKETIGILENTRETVPVSSRDVASSGLASGDGSGVLSGMLMYGFLLKDIALPILAYAKPVRAIFVVGAVVAVIEFALMALIPTPPNVAWIPLAMFSGVLANLCMVLGFLIKPPLSHSVTDAASGHGG